MVRKWGVGKVWSMCGQVKAGGHLRTTQRRRRTVAKNFLQGPTKLDGKDKIKYFAKSWVMPREQNMQRRGREGSATLAVVGVRDKVKLLN